MMLDGIDDRLLEECHFLGMLETGALLLNRNAALAWFILVPETKLQDVLDLPAEHREAVMADCATVSVFLKDVLGYPKTNFAGLGNVVPQMHLHLIGRREGDICWPKPIWGVLPEDAPQYSAEQLRDWQQQLGRLAGLRPAAGGDVPGTSE